MRVEMRRIFHPRRMAGNERVVERTPVPGDDALFGVPKFGAAVELGSHLK